MPAAFVDKVPKGAKPADLPVEFSTKIEMVQRPGWQAGQRRSSNGTREPLTICPWPKLRRSGFELAAGSIVAGLGTVIGAIVGAGVGFASSKEMKEQP
jgi:hypothetical protein